MDEPWSQRRAPIVAIVVILIGLWLAMVVVGGGSQPTILSTVGAAINTTTDNAGSAPGTTTGDTPDDGGTPKNGPVVADAAAGPPTLLIVRTGTLELEVASLGSTVVAAGNLVTAAGGYISGSEESAATDDASASVVYRIPAAAWDRTLTGLRGLATTVRHQQVDTEEVTGQVVDLGARIANLRATEAALQAIMVRATKIPDVLDVQKQLTDTRGEIERLVADKTQLEGRAAYGSLTVTFNLPVPAAVTTAAKGWDPATDIDRATGRLIAIGQAATSAGIFLAIVGLPLLIGGGLLVVIGWQFIRVGRWLLARRTVEGGLPV
jgi:Domain of unknown function (DUF4349)